MRIITNNIKKIIFTCILYINITCIILYNALFILNQWQFKGRERCGKFHENLFVCGYIHIWAGQTDTTQENETLQ